MTCLDPAFDGDASDILERYKQAHRKNRLAEEEDFDEPQEIDMDDLDHAFSW